MLQTTATTSLASLVRDYVAYNLWSTQTLIGWLKTKPAELMDKEIGSSFPGIKQTLAHIWYVEMGWIGFLKQSPVQIPYGVKYEESIDTLFDTLMAQSQDFNSYIQSLNDEELEQSIHVVLPFMDAHLRRYDIIQHSITHSAYHRGQIVTMGHHLGINDAPMTDYLFYLTRAKGTN
jgi:uncharacterized damage-inducible protein DinB